jgi:alpha-amylase/alpha-mannosidase (GH57 family)
MFSNIQPKQNDPLYIVILWHMHQPIYRRVRQNGFLLPWVRLHALKDYYDMVDVAREFPDVHLTFNLVPSLLDQLDDYSERGLEDDFLIISRKAARELDLDDKIFLLKNFFSLNFDNMIQPFARYRELFEKRGHVGKGESLKDKAGQFSLQDFRDLQVWYNLAWSGNKLRQTPELDSLIRKQRNFTEEDKLTLFRIQGDFMKKIIPIYRDARDSGQIELSVSPFYHPILPLLLNINSAREALPNIDLPRHDFHHPEDVLWHVRKAIENYQRHFGDVPRGMWPSEGSVSGEILPILRKAGIEWVASDEEVLKASLWRSGQLREGSAFTPERKYTAYRSESDAGDIHMFFRDHLLSDMIGFTYSTYDGESAANDLISRLLLIRKMLPDDSRRYVVPLILDGENAWEYYPANGVNFLRAFYAKLSESPFLRAVTFSEYLNLGLETPILPKIQAGSWIYGTFSTWVGHQEKNKAWDLLAATRKKLERFTVTTDRRDESAVEALARAHEEVMIAEGSDWFWWYGEDHFSEYDREFDQLFREHLQAAWRHMGTEPPPELSEPIVQQVSRYKVQPPFELLTPELDGRITDYFEWLAAGYFSNQYSFSTMQQIHRIFHGFHFGFDHDNFYIRLDVDTALLNDRKYPFIVEILFRKPGNVYFRMEKDNDRKTLTYERIQVKAKDAEAERRPVPLIGVQSIVELGIPLDDIGIHENQVLEFALAIYIDGNLAERMPHEGYIAQKIAIDDLEKYYWVV